VWLSGVVVPNRLSRFDKGPKQDIYQNLGLFLLLLYWRGHSIVCLLGLYKTLF
jgi:hypothetical protein